MVQRGAPAAGALSPKCRFLAPLMAIAVSGTDKTVDLALCMAFSAPSI